MAGQVWFLNDETGEPVRVSPTNPFPTTCDGGGGGSASTLRAEEPVTYDSETGTVSARANVAGGFATLDSAGKLRSSQLPPLQPDVGEAASEAEMLALDVAAPALAIRTDFTPPRMFMLSNDPATDAANWHDMGGFSDASADPSSLVGLTPTSGTAATYMRSDAAPALDQSIAPTWTGAHTFDGAVAHNAPVDMGGNQIDNLADGTDPQDAVTVAQLDAATSADPGPAAYNAPVPVVLAYKTQDQTIVSGDLRTVTWQATAYDPHGLLSGNTDFIVPDWATHARMTLQVMYSSSGSDTTRRLVAAQVNGEYRPGLSWVIAHIGTGSVNQGFQYTSAVIPVAPGDIITGGTRHYHGSNDRTVVANNGGTWMQIELCPA